MDRRVGDIFHERAYMPHLVEKIHALLESDSPSDNDETDRLVAEFIRDYDGHDLVAVTFQSTSLETSPRCIAAFFDVLPWYPSIDVRKFVSSLEQHYRGGNQHHIDAVEGPTERPGKRR